MQYRPGDLLRRVEESLESARSVFDKFQPRDIEEMKKSGGDPVTAADLELDRVLRENLLGTNEGWLSEETADDPGRLERELVWIVDPLDGTREFIDGLPEFCVSVAAVVSGMPVAGGILNPAANLTIVGALDEGVSCNGEATRPSETRALEDMTVLASRSEWNRGEWQVVEDLGLTVVPMGSVAYKFARVAAGLDDATWTPAPKHEWDLAGGAALLVAAGGRVLDIDGRRMPFNSKNPWVSGAIAVPDAFDPHVEDVIELIRKQRQSE